MVRRLSPTHDMTFGRGRQNFATDQEAVIQKVETRLLTLLGEWFLDTSAGVPWMQEINVKPANPPYAESLVKACITDTDGVTAITSFSYSFNHGTRKWGVAASITTEYNETATPLQVSAP
jgi:hypothetical protein